MYIIQLSANAVQFLQRVCDARSGLRMGTEAGDGSTGWGGCVVVGMYVCV